MEAPITCDIVIVGAGLVGLASAIGLQKLGHRVTALDRAESFPKISAGIAIPPNATRALKNLDVLDSVSETAVQPTNLIVRSYRDGDVLANQPYLPDLLDKYNAPYFSAHRATFHDILLKKAESLGVKIKLKAILANIDFVQGTVHLEDGQVYKADLILGADGSNSQCRELFQDRHEPPIHAGDTIFAMDIEQKYIWEQENLREFLQPPNVNMWFGPETHVVVFALREDGLVHIIGSRYEDPKSKIRARPQPMDMAELRNYFKDWDPRLRKIYDIAKDGMRWTLTRTPELLKRTHSDGKFALIGDAAHAMSPFLAQGAAMGIEDAAVLIELFSRLSSKSQIPDLLAIYERIRNPRAQEMKRRSASMRNVFALHNGPEQQERDRQIKEHAPFHGYPLPWMDPVFQNWLYSYDAKQEVEKAWEIYCRGEWPGTRGSWKLQV
ncbi:hypothetical protein ACMFMG_010737 [Clarireedia jacksonii]